MDGGSKNVEQKKKLSSFKVIEKVHPHKMILYVSMLAGLLVYAFMLMAFSMSIPGDESINGLVLPKTFTVSTIIVMYATYLSGKIMPSYRRDKHQKVKDYFAGILGLLLLYALFQSIGWIELSKMNFLNQIGPAEPFAAVIIGMHIVFSLLAFTGCVYFLLRSWKLIHDPVKRLIFTTNPYEAMKLEMFSAYMSGYNFMWLIIFFTIFFTF